MKLELGIRKIQVIRDTAFVSLPRTWIKSIGLEKGDKVSISLRDDGILEISSQPKEGDDA
jgi:antitoxin component of MazEF toxin-antitoxin module